MKKLMRFVLTIVLFLLTFPHGFAQEISVKNLDKHMARFVEKPHPAGTPEQKKLAVEYAKTLKAQGYKANLQSFEQKIPKPNTTTKGFEVLSFHNVIASKKGRDNCSVLIGGHFDTKQLPNFVGANDGGSSTALMLELARAVKGLPVAKKKIERWADCTLAFVFFDGEEAVLEDWSEGEKKYGIVDHLYGSQKFATDLESKDGKVLFENKPIVLLLLVDMIGHKNQKIFATSGSDPKVFEQMNALKEKVDLVATNLDIEDDHLPLAKRGVRFVHLIDWTNISEWHTPKDNLEIISTPKIAAFGNVILKFLQEKRVP